MLGSFILGIASGAFAYHPITVPTGPLRWPGNDVSFVIHEAGSDDSGDGSDATAVREAFRTWNELGTLRFSFTEDGTADPSRTDWTSDDIHLIYFDEANATLLFPPGSGIIALTPIQYDASGTILDADIIFNGKEYSFSTTGDPDRYDIQSIATHEIGHMLGLDHSGFVASSIFPYADPGTTHVRALTEDDIAGATLLYPDSHSFASATGSAVRDADGSAISGAQIAALDDQGIIVASALSGGDGTFTIFGLPTPQIYRFYAAPFEGPAGEEDLASSVPARIDTDFQGTYLGGNEAPLSVPIDGPGTYPVGTIHAGAPGALSITSASAFPFRAPQGTFQTFYVAGDGIVSGTSFSVTGSGITIVATFFYTVGDDTAAQVLYAVQKTAPIGPRTITATRGNDIALLTAGLEVTAPVPWITAVSPSQGLATGGELVTLQGGNLPQSGTVFFGPYRASGYTWVDATEVRVTSPAGAAGTVDVSLHGADGQMARKAGAFQFIAQPRIDGIFPAKGSTTGETSASIFGADFVDGLSITIAGSAASVVSITSTRVDIQTPAGSAGLADLVATNPGGLADTLQDGYEYIDAADPQIDSFSPPSGGTAGGTRLVILGNGFRSGLLVRVGAEPDGSGGDPAQDVEVVSDTQIVAYTPAASAGDKRLLVVNADGTAGFASSTFLYVAGGGGGGGGGCGALPGCPGRRRRWDGLGHLLAIALWALLRCLRARRLRFAHAPGACGSPSPR